MSTFSWVYKPYTFWDPPPPKKGYTSTFFWVPKIHPKIIKIRLKVKSVWKKSWFSQTQTTSLPKVYGLYTHENLTFMDGPLLVFPKGLCHLTILWPSSLQNCHQTTSGQNFHIDCTFPPLPLSTWVYNPLSLSLLLLLILSKSWLNNISHDV